MSPRDFQSGFLRSVLLLAAALSPAAAGRAGAAISNPPHADLFFLTEHLPEAAQDARVYALLWPEGRLSTDWKLRAGLMAADAGASVAAVRGGGVMLGAARAWSERSGISLFAFYDRFELRAADGEEVLGFGGVAGVPLDLPERAAIANASGTVRHFGAGLLFEHAFDARLGEEPRWDLLAGAMVDRLERDALVFPYRLLAGADAGARGTVEQSGSNTYITALLGVQRVVPLGARLLLLPRVAAGAPLPAGDLHTRITGPGFDLSTRDPGGRPGKIGDGFVALGIALRDRPSGLEIDLGASLLYPLFERLTHDGLDRSLLVAVSWHAR